MPLQTIDHDSLFEQLRTGLTLVTGNSRLSRVLTGQYGQWRIGRGDLQWASPRICSWDAWLGQLWDEAGLQGIAGTDGAIPGKLQLISLWEHVLRDDPHTQQLLRPESLATQLRDTRRLLVDWQLDLAHPAWFGDQNENFAAFHKWNRAFEALCRQHHWIPPEDRTALLSRAARDSLLAPAGPIGLLGFDELNPARFELITALRHSGNKVSQLSITPAKRGAGMWSSTSSKAELQKMARWVRHWFEEEPGSRIAVVVPDLQARRQEVERHLEEILMPNGMQASGQAKPWNFSMGTPLARAPMVKTAFDLLGLLDRRIDIQDIGRALRSPWIRGGISERKPRALLEKCLRDNYPRQLKLSEVHYRSRELRKFDRNHQQLPEDQQEPHAWNCPAMAAVLNTLMQFERHRRGTRRASAWAEAFDQLLASLGWPLSSQAEERQRAARIPGEHDVNWQAFEAWQDALRELASLDASTAELGRRTAISQLHQICREKVFQPHTPPASIQILGLYEASGLRFDHMWVLGLHNDNWPPAARPNPFIPGSLQQNAALPHSSPQRELEVARVVTERLLETADDTVFSYPGQLDGEAILASPLLTGKNTVPLDEVPVWRDASWLSIVSKAGDLQTVPLAMPRSLGKGVARGGSSILKNQALCPFRAFANNRLAADGLESPVDGISAKLHGSLVHRVLEHFWKETKTQQALTLLDDECLAARIRKHVDHVLDEERGLIYRPAFRKVETGRLVRQVSACLELEKTREPFEVEEFEKEIMAEIEGQAIRLIIDRIDRLPCGDKAIIDYKTGKVDPRKWFGDRPEDPQLPLYAISAEDTPAAVVFAVIRDDGCLYKGVAQREGIFPGLPPKLTRATGYLVEAGAQMPETIRDWRQILHRLMSDFLAGKADIDPKDGTNTCLNSYCDLHSLCRISEREVSA